MELFATRLKELRAVTQCTQKKLSSFLGLTPNCICEWENNRSEPSIISLTKIASYFEVSVDYLLGLEDDFGTPTAAAMGDGMTADERELLRLYRELSPYLKGVALDTVRGWADKEGGGSLHKKA